MKISGFSFARNAVRYSFPIAEAIRSALPLCDEFIIALGKGDDDDRTREAVFSIGDPKLRIIDTVWPQPGAGGHIYSGQTNIALDACTGDWCFYLQCDEVLHERYLPVLRARCQDLLADRAVEGLLFTYRHFWGDYDHCQDGHKWYPAEIRMVRNGIGVRSIGDAQSFRIGGRKLRVALARAEIYHYGYVRPPRLMQRRNYATEVNYWGTAGADRRCAGRPPAYDFGPLDRVPVFRGTHPAVMRERIAAMDWKHELQYSGAPATRHKHDRAKYRLLTWIERTFLGGRRLGGYRNYVLINR